MKLTFGPSNNGRSMCSIAAGLRSRSRQWPAWLRSPMRRREAQTFLARQGRNPKVGGKDRRKSSFAAGENFGEIVRRAKKTFDAIARPSFDQTRRPALGHFGPGGRTRSSILRIRRLATDPCPDRFNSAVRHDDFQRDHVIGSCAVDWATRTGRIIGDHSAKRGARAGCHVRSETKSVRLQEIVELVQHDSGADAGRCVVQGRDR